MSSGTVGEGERTRQLLARLEEAYRAGKISKEVYERLSCKYREQVGISGQAVPRPVAEGRLSDAGTSGPRIVAVSAVGYRPAPKKDSAQLAIAIVTFLMVLGIVLVAIISAIRR